LILVLNNLVLAATLMVAMYRGAADYVT
jgi:putative phosphoribosyl transferase